MASHEPQTDLPALVKSMSGCAIGRHEVAASKAAASSVASPARARLSEKAISRCDGDDGPSERMGSGWGGTRTPTDDFVDLRRKSSWCRDGSSAKALPPRVYIDNKTLIREVQDLSKLKRGDHCVIALNVLRATTPLGDWAISWLGSCELIYLYHHFIVLDDVEHIDDAGVPRTADGQMAMIVEWGNTIPEAAAEVLSTSAGRLCRLPMTMLKFLFFGKAKFSKHPLADYGDTPHIYLVLAKQTPEERERIVAEALRMESQEQRRYHVIFNNCEHACHKIRYGHHHSAQISFLCWTAFRLLLGLVGLMALKMNQDWAEFADTCYSTLCLNHRGWGTAAYHIFTSVPVALQAMISYILLMRSVLCQRQQSLISRHECCHLLGKELGRAIVVGSWTVLAICLTPNMVSNFLLRLVICSFAYIVSDMVYNCFAHAFMRLVLLPAYGRVWLLGPADPCTPKKDKAV